MESNIEVVITCKVPIPSRLDYNLSILQPWIISRLEFADALFQLSHVSCLLKKITYYFSPQKGTLRIN